MAKSIKVRHKKRGRPATGKSPTITIRLPQPLIDGLDSWCEESGVTRSDALRNLIESELRKPRPKAGK
jgi:metal-responsive CopG/Arc/MetJ family transcriptional regulator